MRSRIFAFLLLLSLILLFINLNDAREDPGDYWKSIMKDQPIPEAIKTLFHRDPPYLTESRKNDHFLRDFDVTPNAIIYHARVEGNEEKKPCVQNMETKRDTADVGLAEASEIYYIYAHDAVICNMIQTNLEAKQLMSLQFLAR